MSKAATRRRRFNMLLSADEHRMLRELAVCHGLNTVERKLRLRLALELNDNLRRLGGCQ